MLLDFGTQGTSWWLPMTTNESIRANGKRWQNNHISPSKLNVWLKCPAAFWFHYIKRLPRKNKVFFPQGTAVHFGVEILNKDLNMGKTPDYDYYVLKMEEVWNEEIERGGELFDSKDNEIAPSRYAYHFNEVERWFKIYFDAAKRGAVPDFDPASVIETELDVMRRVIHPVHGDLGVFIRGKIDWVIDLESDVARLADLKTASTHWMGQWSETKASSQLQATAYGYAVGKDLDFSYMVIPKASAKDAPSTRLEHYRTKRGATQYAKLEDLIYNFVQQTDVLNNYEGFVPYPNPDPSKYKHCNKLCDYKAACQKEFFE
ncbi:MAG: hypothetical protein CME55_04585 [Halieaceae bacterium]|nr:hypothetical protein [Halieaceae bacterium]